MVTVSGRSNDLIVLSGDIDEHIEYKGTPVVFKFDEGTQVRVKYNEQVEVWDIHVNRKGKGFWKHHLPTRLVRTSIVEIEAFEYEIVKQNRKGKNGSAHRSGAGHNQISGRNKEKNPRNSERQDQSGTGQLDLH